MDKKTLLLVLLTLFIVSACESDIPENPDNPKKEETIRLRKILVKGGGNIEFNYFGNQVSEMICVFTGWKTPVYADFEFRYDNEI